MQLAETGGRNTKNARGRVRVQFQLVEGGKPVKGNQSTSFNLDDVTVTEARDAFIEYLQSDEDEGDE